MTTREVLEALGGLGTLDQCDDCIVSQLKGFMVRTNDTQYASGCSLTVFDSYMGKRGWHLSREITVADMPAIAEAARKGRRALVAMVN